MKRYLTRHNAMMALLVLALVLPFAAGGVYLFAKYQWAEDSLADMEPRYARLLGIEAGRADLTKALAESGNLLSRYVYPSSQDVTQAGNDAQQRIRDISTQAGLLIVSSQVLPPKSETQFDRVPVTVRLEGELSALQSALIVLGKQSPAILFEGFSVQTIGAVKAEVPQRLGIQFNLFVLRAKESWEPPAATAPASAASSAVAGVGASPPQAALPAPALSAAASAPPRPATSAPVAAATSIPPVSPPSPGVPSVAPAAPPPPAGGPTFGGGATFGGPVQPARSAP